MKLLLLILLTISCSKVIDKKIDEITVPEPVIDRLETDGMYAQKIDVMVAFLWPARIESDSQRSSVRAIISGSRKLKDLQDVYFQKKLKLNRAWKKGECDCVLNGICGETVPETPYDVCQALEDEVFANERALPDIYAIVEKMKSDVIASGGEWLKTHTDFPEGPVSEIDFSGPTISLSAFAPTGEPQPYPPAAFTLRRSVTFESLELRFRDQSGRGEWRFDMAIQRTPEAMKFQGKLFLETSSSTREGIVYWMNPVIL